MKILLLTDGISPFVIGGMQKHSTKLCSTFLDQNIFVTLIHCTNNQKEIKNEDVLNLFPKNKHHLLKIHYILFPKLKIFPGHYLRASKKYSENIFNLMKDEMKEYDFIFSQGFTSWYLTKNRKKQFQLPPIGIHFHGFEMFQKSFSFKEKLEKRILKRAVLSNLKNADIIFSLGGEINNLIKTISSKPILLSQNAIDESWLINDLPNKKQDIFKFIFIGRNEARKGLDQLNKALQNIDNHNLNYEVHFIGPIPKKEQLSLDNIFYYGEIKDSQKIKSLLKQMDCLICPSLAEGMPTVILEAMATGLSIIATNVGATSSLVNSENGFLISPGNTSELISAITKLQTLSLKKIEKLKTNSLIKSKSFSWSNVGKQTIEEIKNYVNN